MQRAELHEQYRRIRRFTLALCEPLAVEDYVVQTMPDVSPTKWHLAHTTWFFETFVLSRAQPGYMALDERYAYLFNSYYNAVGDEYPRERRGLISRPTVAEVRLYRQHVDGAMETFFSETAEEKFEEHAAVVEVGLHHEEQHQELLLTDIKHVLAESPMHPVYRPRARKQGSAASGTRTPLTFSPCEGGLVEVGHEGRGFAFDNERPKHKTYLEPFEVARRPTTVGEYLEFIEDGGYRRPELWLAEGWTARKTAGWEAPLYWSRSGATWAAMTLGGLGPLDPSEPVCHLSYFEADAFAAWSKARLPKEEEWEVLATGQRVAGNFVESSAFHPVPEDPNSPRESLAQLFGDVWEWTSSPYSPYPGFSAYPGALGEYNGKFMCNQMVLRGGSCATPQRHIRATYRNFFPTSARWQFSGLRLARS